MAMGIVETDDREHRRAIAYFEEAATLAGDLDLRRRAVLLHSLALAYQEAADHEGAVRAGRESLALYRSADALHEVAVVENQLALAYLGSGNLAGPPPWPGTPGCGTRWTAIGVLSPTWPRRRPRSPSRRRRYEDAIALGREARDLAKATGNPSTHSAAMLTIARAQAASGLTQPALESYATGVNELRERGPVVRLQQGLGEWAELLARAGRHEEAYALTREALHAAEDHASRNSGTMRRVRGTGSPQDGRHPRASQATRRAPSGCGRARSIRGRRAG